jgi:hypothetical protein
MCGVPASLSPELGNVPAACALVKNMFTFSITRSPHRPNSRFSMIASEFRLALSALEDFSFERFEITVMAANKLSALISGCRFRALEATKNLPDG